MPASLPPYLTSGASSRVHHALLVALNEAKSAQQEDEILNKELKRCRYILGVKGQSTSKIADTLIVLLHCWMVPHRVLEDSGEWALVPALQLAEGGRRLRERRIGYLYLTERLPSGHELSLMLVNTIRKDLSSSAPQEVLLALHTIVKLPSHDLAPAVTPLLTNKRLLRHEVPAIRQRTLQALIALHLSDDDLSRTIGPRTFPLSLPKIIKLLGQETDSSVVAVILRLIRLVLVNRVYRVKDEDERGYLVEEVVAQGKRSNAGEQLVLEVLRTCGALLRDSDNSLASGIAVQWLKSRLTSSSHKRDGALILETCSLISSLPTLLHTITPLMTPIIRQISHLLSPADSSSTTSPLPRPNDHLLALRCLSLLPRSAWDGAMGESEMRTIMEGLNSPDPTIRVLTLRLLHRLASQLLDAALQNHLESLASLSNLALPINLPSNTAPERKLRLAKEETALRGLEVVEVQAQPDGGAARGVDTGSACSRAVLAVLDALHGEDRADVWETGLQRVIQVIKIATPDFRNGFVAALFEAEGNPNATLTVLRATVSTQDASPVTEQPEKVVQVLLRDIRSHTASIQELCLVAAIGILSRQHAQNRASGVATIARAAKDVRKSTGRYMQKRASQILDILSHDLLDEVRAQRKSGSLPDILHAIISVHTAHERSRLPSTPVRSSSSSPPASLRSAAVATSLRYDAYDAPRNTSASCSPHRGNGSTFRSPPASQRTGRARLGMSAGEYALMEADEYGARNDDDSVERVEDNLMGLSLDGRSPRHAEHPDPFNNDHMTPRL